MSASDFGSSVMDIDTHPHEYEHPCILECPLRTLDFQSWTSILIDMYIDTRRQLDQVVITCVCCVRDKCGTRLGETVLSGIIRPGDTGAGAGAVLGAVTFAHAHTYTCIQCQMSSVQRRVSKVDGGITTELSFMIRMLSK